MEITTPTPIESTISFTQEELEKLYLNYVKNDYSDKDKVSGLWKTISKNEEFRIQSIIDTIETNIQRIKIVVSYLPANVDLLAQLLETQKMDNKAIQHREEEMKEIGFAEEVTV